LGTNEYAIIPKPILESKSPAMPQQANAPLPVDFILENYRVGRQLSSGGFSLVYLGYDEYGDEVAIKEYLPASLAVRKEGQVKPNIGEENLTTFRYGMKCFFEEGRALARLSHPNVVRVLNFFRANETVYMVMKYEQGKTLQELILGKGVKEDFIRQTFVQLLNGLREVHSHKLLHLDIKPANTYVRKDDGSPVLLDFGAARQTLTEGTTRLKPMYTPGFASPEQYRNRERLGPWSDIYSVGATLYACVTALAPQPADARLSRDLLVPAKVQAHGKYSEQLLETIDWCLKLDYLSRPQTGFQLQKALSEGMPPLPKGGGSKVTEVFGKLFGK
jgi:serine/threonine protein kinase